METFKAKNILLVDDEPNFLKTVAAELRDRSSNFCVLTAENGERALKILESAPVDLVVTDLRMPVMDGFSLLSHTKRNYPHIPVIVMSASLCPELEARLRDLGAAQCIEKPDIGTLDEMVVKMW